MLHQCKAASRWVCKEVQMSSLRRTFSRIKSENIPNWGTISLWRCAAYKRRLTITTKPPSAAYIIWGIETSNYAGLDIVSRMDHHLQMTQWLTGWNLMTAVPSCNIWTNYNTGNGQAEQEKMGSLVVNVVEGRERASQRKLESSDRALCRCREPQVLAWIPLRELVSACSSSGTRSV